jgi:hypothetical protein
VPGLAAAASAAVTWLATRHGPGLTPDSLSYLLLARSLRAGEGFLFLGRPEAHFPPGYPAALAVAGALAGDELAGARWLAAACAALCGGMAVLAVQRSRPGTRAPALAAAGLLICSPALLGLRGMAWSETLFLPLLLAAWVLLARLLGERSHRTLAAVVALLGAAALTRYAGLAFVVGASLTLGLARGRDRRERLREAGFLLLAASAPLAAWLVRNALRAGSAADRQLAWHPLELQQLFAAFGALGELIAGETRVALLAAGLAVLALGWGAAQAFASAGAPGAAPPLLRVMGVSCACYVVFLTASLSLADADTPLDPRILAPVGVAGGLGLALAAGRLTRTGQAAPVLLLALALSAVPADLAALARLQADGEGFASATWRESALVAAASALPRGPALVSNAHDFLAWRVGRAARRVPARFARTTATARPEFPGELAQLCRELTDGRAALVWFDAVDWAWDLPDRGSVESACGRPPSAAFADGVLFERPGGAAASATRAESGCPPAATRQD